MRQDIPLRRPTGWHPGEDSVFYECLRCQTVVPSLPEDSEWCGCGNVKIDVSYHRISIDDESKVRAFIDPDLRGRKRPFKSQESGGTDR